MAAEQYHKPWACEIYDSPLQFDIMHTIKHWGSVLTPTCRDCKSRELLPLTSSNGHRLDSMRRWARMSFRSLLRGLPDAGGDGAPDGMGLMASTFVMTTCRMFSMASTLEMASRLPSPSHLPSDSCSCTSMVRCGACNTCAVLQWATQQQTQQTVFVNSSVINTGQCCEVSLKENHGHQPVVASSGQVSCSN